MLVVTSEWVVRRRGHLVVPHVADLAVGDSRTGKDFAQPKRSFVGVQVCALRRCDACVVTNLRMKSQCPALVNSRIHLRGPRW